MNFDAVTLDAATASSADIVKWVRDRAPLAIRNWNEIGADEYARAFAVAGTTGYDVIGDIYEALSAVIEMGGTERDFAELITPILRKKGWLADTGQNLGARVQLIYDTNLRVSRSIGRWQRVNEVASVLPYLVGKTVGDLRVRQAHTAFDGICLPVNHPFWQSFWPPMFFRCRCDVIQLSRSQFRRRGLTVTPESEVKQRAELIRPQSWGYNVALIGQQAIMDKVGEANVERVPGAPALNAQTLGDEGRQAWQRIMGLAISQLIEGLAKAFSPI